MAIQLERTADYDLVRKILTHPKLYRWMSEDGSPEPEAFRTNEHPAISYVIARDGDEILGLFTLLPLNSVTSEVHVAMLPESWGPRAAAAAAAFVRWVWSNTPCRRLVAAIPSNNRLAMRFAAAAGLGFFGRNRNAFPRNGELWDLCMFGLSRTD